MYFGMPNLVYVPFGPVEMMTKLRPIGIQPKMVEVVGTNVWLKVFTEQPRRQTILHNRKKMIEIAP
tara:strand:+ start:67 stop:264 length:198 start_codon:yes stop_codon:yes gene_type:complete